MITVDTQKCDACGTCISVCDSRALSFQESITIDINLCIQCGKCVRICPFGAISLVKDTGKIS